MLLITRVVAISCARRAGISKSEPPDHVGEWKRGEAGADLTGLLAELIWKRKSTPRFSRQEQPKGSHSLFNSQGEHRLPEKGRKEQDTFKINSAANMAASAAHLRRRHLTPTRATPDVAGMFDDYSFLLSGTAFEERFEALGMVAKQNFLHTSDLLGGLRAQRWEDTLRPDQAGKYAFVDRPEAWEVVSPPLALALATVPVLGLGAEVECGGLKYLTITTYDANTVTFNLTALTEATPSWLRRAEVLPRQVLDWLQDPNIFLLTAGLAPLAANSREGLVMNNHIDCTQIFTLYQTLGVIHPTFSVAEPDSAWMLTYAIGYHHRPMEERRFNYLVGHHHYATWPEHRHPEWRPRPKVLPGPTEKFYFFYDANGPFAFIYRLILHGLVYGGMAAVQLNADFALLVTDFLRGAGLPRAQVRLRDPLGLTSDVGTAAFPPFAVRVPVRDAPPPPFSSTDPLQRGRDAPAAAVSLAPSAIQQGTAEVEVVGERKREETTPPPPAEQDMIDLTDQALVAELDQEAVTGAEGTAPTAGGRPPPDHPGYYTSAGAKRSATNIQDRSEDATPQGIFAQMRRRRQDPRGGPRSDRGGGAGGSAPRFTGGNQEPLADSLTPPGETRAELSREELQGDLRQRLEDRAQEELPADDLRHRLPPPQGGGRGKSNYCVFDARCSLNSGAVTAHASVFADAAAGAPTEAPLGTPDAKPGMTFLRRLSARNRMDPSPIVASESLLAAPVDKKAVAQPHLTRLEKAWNPYMKDPIFDHRCTVCSSHHCSRYIKGGRIPNCKKWREECYVAPSRRLCDYRRCRRPRQHHTVVCPYLHGRCSKCGVRGHDEHDQCAENDNSIMARLQEDFEEQANVGLLTRNRASEVAWGFFPVPATAPRTSPPFFDYRTLLEKPAAAGIAFVRALVAAESNQVAPPDALDEDNAFKRAANPRPAPPEGWSDRNSEALNPGSF